jgi:hypothetical protein
MCYIQWVLLFPSTESKVFLEIAYALSHCIPICLQNTHPTSAEYLINISNQTYEQKSVLKKKKKNSMVWVRERTIPTERPQLVGEVIANFLWIEFATWSAWRIPRPYSRISRQEPLLFYQVAPQLYSQGWVDPVPDPLLFYFWECRESNPGLQICSQELWTLDHRTRIKYRIISLDSTRGINRNCNEQKRSAKLTVNLMYWTASRRVPMHWVEYRVIPV